MARVLVKDLVKDYGKVHAVKGINLEVTDKEFVCLLGPSGCGKSSTLRMIAGLEEITKGDIYIGDKRVNDLWPRERDIAMVFENYALYPNMNVYDNIAFPLRSQRISPREVQDRVKEALRILKIEDLAFRGVSELSGGQRQRVAIGRTIVRKPAVFLLDEPISHLDAKLRDQMRGELKRLQKDLGTTTIYVSHDQIEAMTMADRIAVMNDGEILQCDTPEVVFHNPVSMFVAFFVGSPSINFITGNLITAGKRFEVAWDNCSIKIPERYLDSVKNLTNSQPVTIGIRPQNISISRARSTNEDLEGEVFITQPLGEEIMIELHVGSVLLTVSTSISDGGNLQIGDRAFVRFDSSRLHLFDTATEANLLT
jgi:multiple sugar transport system ATP-binding protein